MKNLTRRALVASSAGLLLSACAPGSIGPQAPQLSVASVAVQSISLNAMNLIVGVNAQNPNAFNLPLTGLGVDLEVAGVKIGRGTLPQAVTLPAGRSVQLPIQVSANPLQLGLQAPMLLQQPTLPYRVTGTANVGGFQIPLPISKSGVLQLR